MSKKAAKKMSKEPELNSIDPEVERKVAEAPDLDNPWAGPQGPELHRLRTQRTLALGRLRRLEAGEVGLSEEEHAQMKARFEREVADLDAMLAPAPKKNTP